MTLPDEHLAPAARARRGSSRACRDRCRSGGGARRGSTTAPTTPRIGSRAGVPVATSSREAVALCHWNAGAAALDGDAISGEFDSRDGERLTFALASASREPLVMPSRAAAEARLDEDGRLLARVDRRARIPRRVDRRRPPQRAGAEAADFRALRRDAPPRRRRRCRKRSAANATGTTGAAGFAIRTSSSTRCSSSDATTRRRRCSGGSCRRPR